MKAIFNDRVIAESDETEVVEGNHYFPKESVKEEYFQTSDTHTRYPWKGKASYYNIEVDGKVAKDAAWYYPDPSTMAKKIKNHVAFWKEVQVTD